MIETLLVYTSSITRSISIFHAEWNIHETELQSYLTKFSYNEIEIISIKYLSTKRKEEKKKEFSIKEHISRDMSAQNWIFSPRPVTHRCARYQSAY